MTYARTTHPVRLRVCPSRSGPVRAPTCERRELLMKQILFSNDPEFWYETQRSFGQIAYGGGDFGEVLEISEQIAEGDYGGSYDA